MKDAKYSVSCGLNYIAGYNLYEEAAKEVWIWLEIVQFILMGLESCINLNVWKSLNESWKII